MQGIYPGLIPISQLTVGQRHMTSKHIDMLVNYLRKF
ncbi:hypothetical protein fHeYen902_057c [Yersinia phage fHe-Yen9-02]|nr:hypothetical protein fHeYen902_057c [Yersinia phage fHe-Yen9-02]